MSTDVLNRAFYVVSDGFGFEPKVYAGKGKNKGLQRSSCVSIRDFS
jgi:hypothetical protein